ncbi:1-phosphofructokinase family hexose kinase [Mucilaginibacter sp. RS28]|uniref:1-phosphofructokinase family hexose kinase n=1 Tax=Mucilaginibacter straminoryzae TaxID=2932774 RepID=A0A9X2B8D4_9SPHI|nr:1-phosphofructokinase family hexose kinase [Mucilaginibacter straminoryzae]MCJ8209356.1 1-phosphofructokinase family hexose kinase [Mucilaginibacter straminoryzae]
MKQIVTLTLAPTIDKSSSVEEIIPEHKLQCSEPKFEPGGGGINVSRGLKRLGLDSVAIYPSGGLTGQRLHQLLQQEGLEQHPIATRNLTRENFIVVSRKTNEQFRFGMPCPELLESEEEEILTTIRHMQPKPEYIVVSGRMPPGIKDDFIAEIARIAKEDRAKLIVDTSGEALRYAVEEGVYLLKPNQNELSKLTGKNISTIEDVKKAAEAIINKGKCEVIVVSLGGDGALLATRGFTEHIKAPPVEKRSTVGAGDSMVAGMVYGCEKKMDVRHMVRMGIACGSAATMNPGTELFKKENAERLYLQMIAEL